MTGETSTLLLAFQHADSFFPGGATAFSWGLESLVADGIVRDAGGVYAFVQSQIRHRWATSDRPMLLEALAACDNLDQILSLDGLVDAVSLSARMREGSSRCGTALLSVHARLGLDVAESYRGLVREGRAFGHLVIVQGLVWGRLGVTPTLASAMSAHGFCQSIVSAAIRLGIMSHLDGQRSLERIRPIIAGIMESATVTSDRIHAYVPQSEIAAMRHEVQDSRLFAN